MYSAVCLPGRMPGMKPPYFFMFSARSIGLSDDRRVEVGEEDDHQAVEDDVERRARREAAAAIVCIDVAVREEARRSCSGR